MPATFYEALPRRDACKHGAVVWQPVSAPGVSAGLIRIDTDYSSDRYALAEFAADGGRAFVLGKLTRGTDRRERRYACFIPVRAGLYPVCECRGFAGTGHCKHLDSIQALLANRWL